MLRRAALAVLSTALVAAGLLAGATPANAASASPASEAIIFGMPNTTFSGAAGDTFILTNGYSDAYVINATGSVALSGDPCATSADCVVTTSSGTITLELVSSGTFEVRHTGGVLIGTLTASVSGPSTTAGPTDPALVYPTVTFDSQGGTCTTPSTITNNNGSNPTYTMPTGKECSRPGYILFGWSPVALNADGFRPMGSRVYPYSFTANLTESVTLYAVWGPTGVEVTYDANVGPAMECLAGGASTSTRTTTSVVAPGSTSASTAPCSPPNLVFAGWALTGDGEVAVQPGAAIPSTWVAGYSHRLYAKWKVTYGVSVSQLSQDIAPGSTPSVTITATRNGQPARGAALSYQWTGEDEFGPFALESQTVTLNDLGAATVSMGANVGSEGFATIAAAYGDTTASATFTVVQPVIKSIAITGERAPVKGKPGIVIDGVATGFAEGVLVVPHIKFAGQTSYSEDTARPTVDADGQFSWQRKTGKKIYVFFTSEDGTVRSARIIILAK